MFSSVVIGKPLEKRGDPVLWPCLAEWMASD